MGPAGKIKFYEKIVGEKSRVRKGLGSFCKCRFLQEMQDYEIDEGVHR